MKNISKINDNQKKAILATILIYALFLVLLFFIRFMSPSANTQLLLANGGGGVTINFGNTDFGSGANTNNQELDIKNNTTSASNDIAQSEDILTNDNTDNTTISLTKNNKKSKVLPIEKTPIESETEKKATVSKNTNNVLDNILKGTKTKGDGNDKGKGNKGKLNGSLNSNDYYGGSGTGNGTGTGSGNGAGSGSGTGGGIGYTLGNRKAISKPSPQYTCNESGRVAVAVTVDKNGNTITATPGVKGTTNTARCLLEQAKIAAMQTKWQPSNDAPNEQVGKIIYSFSLN